MIGRLLYILYYNIILYYYARGTDTAPPRLLPLSNIYIMVDSGQFTEVLKLYSVWNSYKLSCYVWEAGRSPRLVSALCNT